MLAILVNYLERLQGLHTAIERIVNGLPQAALDWTPRPEMNSIHVLAVHVAGSERYWIGDVAGIDPSGRDRDAEFRAHGLDTHSLIDLLDRTLAHSRAVLEGLELADLEDRRVSPHNSRQVTVAWCLAHALEHTALHVGHMEITKQLWEQNPDSQ
jgi:uncharacterized damage-inducible protein DinB